MRSLLYLSSATRPINDNELLDILKVSRRNNQRVGVTGMLLYRGGNFIQVLEGPDDAVQETYDRIERDNRHADVMMVLNEKISERRFSEWSMGFQNVDRIAPEKLAGVSHFLHDESLAQDLMSHPSRASTFLLAFRELMR